MKLPSVSRPTALWREQGRLAAEGLQAAWADPEIRACWTAIAFEVHAALKPPVESWGTAPHVSPIWEQIGVEPEAVFSRLISLLQERVPALAHVWGPDLGMWVLGLTIGLIAPEIGAATPATIARFLPDNPVTASRDPSTGEAMLHGAETATTRHLMQIRSYFQSLLPPGKPGRPKGSPKPSKSGRRSVSPKAALRAYDMDSRGAHWREIAKALWPPMTPAELRSEKTRLKVRYYIERGDRLTRKKPVE
jgi:hypothetical protein